MSTFYKLIRYYLISALIVFTGYVSGVTYAGEGRIDPATGDVFFNVNFRFPPTRQQINNAKEAINLMAFGFCDATEGQLRVKRVTFSGGQANEDKGDFWIHPTSGRGGVSFLSDGSDLGRLGKHITMFSNEISSPDIYLHEFGHLALGLADEYDEQRRWGGPCGIGPGFDAGRIDERNHSIMQQSGRSQCVGGTNNGNYCGKNADCGSSGACQFVLMSEFAVSSNFDPLRGTGGSCPNVSPPCAPNDPNYCATMYNNTTQRYETTQQFLLHGLADWQIIARNYPFLRMPTGLPIAAAPSQCFRPVEFTENILGSDQVLLVLDKSGSMSFSSSPTIAEVCNNGADDDRDGSVDEAINMNDGSAACADPRINFVKQAANAYLDLQRDMNVDVGILTFNQSPTLTRSIVPLNSSNIATYKTIVDSILASGNTGIGDALVASQTEFARIATIGRSRTAYLMTDGYNTSGSNPQLAADRLRDIGVRVHVIPAGSDVKADELGGVAAATKGEILAATNVSDLVAIYAELAGRHRGAALALPRTNFDLLKSNYLNNPKLPPRERSFPILVEKNAKGLVAFVSGRHTKMKDWAVKLSIVGPNGEVFAPGSPQLTVSSHYIFINIPYPSSGTWRLVVGAVGLAKESTLLAFIDNPTPDFFVDTKPHVLLGGGSTKFSANPSYISDLSPQGITMTGVLTKPDGSTTPISIAPNTSSNAWEGRTASYYVDGFYQATFALNVPTGAKLAAGESIFSGPATPAVTVQPFKRYASTSFVVTKAKGWGCLSANIYDCDNDGISGDQECLQYPADIDNDGRPNGKDPDADGDEIPDRIEGLLDRDKNGLPDMCERSKSYIAPPMKK